MRAVGDACQVKDDGIIDTADTVVQSFFCVKLANLIAKYEVFEIEVLVKS